MLNKIKKHIDRHKIISFDIFDTLLVRPYFKPADLFLHLEKMHSLSGFALARMAAEQEARLHNPQKEDITFEEIYAEIDERFKAAKSLETELEKQVLRPNPELKEIYDYAAAQKKTIVIASDMYLPSQFLAEILKGCGYTGFDKIYVSGELNKTKTKGSLFRQILQDYAAEPQDIFHIGDNPKSDYKTPKKLGLQAFLYEQITSQFIKAKHFEALVRKNQRSLGLSILLALQAYHWKKLQYAENTPDYWYDLGWKYAGPSAYGYTRHIKKQEQNLGLKHLLFVARDGYLLQKIYNTFAAPLPNDYIYAPRYINLIYRLGYNKKKIDQMRPIIDYYAAQNPEIKQDLAEADLIKPKDYHKFIQNHIQTIMPLARKAFAGYAEYAQALAGGKNQKIGIIDTVTGEFSSQRLIQSALPNPVCGMYWSILNLPEQTVMENNCYLENTEPEAGSCKIFTTNWNFMEFLITSPEYPIKNLHNGKPVYEENPSSYEITSSRCYKDIEKGALSFCKEINELFKGQDICLSGTDIVEYINCFLANPDKDDFKNMKEIRFGEDSAHTKYVPLTVYACGKGELLHPMKALKLLKQASWFTFPQKLILVLASPLKLKMRGLRVIKLTFLPYLSRRYLTFNLQPAKRILWQLIIGNYRKEK